eukprot:5914192-Alexandrium_andersonii.AAC.1
MEATRTSQISVHACLHVGHQLAELRPGTPLSTTSALAHVARSRALGHVCLHVRVRVCVGIAVWRRVHPCA